LPEKGRPASSLENHITAMTDTTYTSQKGADMSSLNLATLEPYEPPAAAAQALSAREVAAHASVDRLLRCVSSGYMSDGCSCPATIPASVVRGAWTRELDRLGAAEDRFFRFSWRGGEWLAFGLRSGDVRGVYCPAHSAERAERAGV
jgi:hypothetical protein